MNITVLSGGGRGDTQPYVALARGFKEAGHAVRLMTLREFLPLLDGTGLDTLVVDYDPKKMIQSEDGHEMVRSGRNSLRFLLNFSKIIEPLLERAVADLVAACRDTDGLVLASMSMVTGTAGIERLGVPFCAAYPFPATPTAEMPSVFAPPLPRWMPGRGFYNRLTHWALLALARALLGRKQQRILERLPRPARPAPLPAPILYGFSPAVVERPSDWPDHVQLTGYWFLDAPSAYAPPPDLAAFLAAGPPPVYVGFGSMNDRDPEGATRLVCEALERAERRGVLMTGWGGLGGSRLPPHVLAVDSVPHDWLFPKVAAAVHHGGAGTTAASLRAGVPTVCVPHFGDQFFWARRVNALGAGPPFLARRGLTVESLAQAIRAAVSQPAFLERARAVSEEIRRDDAVARAVELASSHFARSREIRSA